MKNENEKQPQKDDLRQQLAKALGADVQRLLVFLSLYEWIETAVSHKHACSAEFAPAA